MKNQAYIKIELKRIDDGSLYYHQMKNYEKFQTFIALYAKCHDGMLEFSSAGRKYLIELDKYEVTMSPMF